MLESTFHFLPTYFTTKHEFSFHLIAFHELMKWTDCFELICFTDIKLANGVR